MKLDCIAFVDERNATLLTRAATTDYASILASVNALTEKHREPVFALRSFVDGNGDEKKVELLTSSALIKGAESGVARVEIWHADPPDFLARHEPGAVVTAEGFKLAAVLLVEDGKEALNAAYRYSQNLDHGWNPVKSSRSSSTGDVFVMTSPTQSTPKAYAVATFGFTPVEFT
jgi:hypothetical protein